VNLYHITTRQQWIEASRQGRYVPPSLAEEGFIHCSTSRQILPVARQFYQGQRGLVLLVVDPARLVSEVKWERPSGGSAPGGLSESDTFPHIYGPIDIYAVLQALDFEPNGEGEFSLPPGLMQNGAAGPA
jgi:uncharacterized protein (DUF952 family)